MHTHSSRQKGIGRAKLRGKKRAEKGKTLRKKCKNRNKDLRENFLCHIQSRTIFANMTMVSYPSNPPSTSAPSSFFNSFLLCVSSVVGIINYKFDFFWLSHTHNRHWVLINSSLSSGVMSSGSSEKEKRDISRYHQQILGMHKLSILVSCDTHMRVR